MKLEIFRSEDFDRSYASHYYCGVLADVANKKLNAWLVENGKVVYGYDSIRDCGTEKWFDEHGSACTKKALLICIEPFQKCRHPKDKVSKTTVMSGDLEPRQIFK